ncbi:hypothetical protein CDO37_17020 [Pseudomonas aeruginosa]|nr:hypothetical protein CDO37_17020 [Pseudomonas aeruginosa]
MGAMASWRAPGVFDYFHLQTPGLKLQIQTFAVYCGVISAMYMGIGYCRAPLLRRMRSRYASFREALIRRFHEASNAPRIIGNVQVMMDFESDMQALERHYAHALDPRKTHGTALAIGLVLAVVSGVLQAAVSG